MMGDTRHEIPFTISPSHGARLAVQAADGFRKAILSGYYKPGDVLPTFRELAKMLGTSIRIPIEASRRTGGSHGLRPHEVRFCRFSFSATGQSRGQYHGRRLPSD